MTKRHSLQNEPPFRTQFSRQLNINSGVNNLYQTPFSNDGEVYTKFTLIEQPCQACELRRVAIQDPHGPLFVPLMDLTWGEYPAWRPSSMLPHFGQRGI